MSTEKEQTTITAVMDRIVYQNDNGFVICQFFDPSNSKKFSGLGNILNPQITMEYKLTGTWEENKQYGPQLKINHHEMVQPKDVNGIYKYIVRVCKFVGATIGHNIIDKYGEQTLEIMKHEPERLAAEIIGITPKRAEEIQATLLENEVNESLAIELGLLLDVPGIRKSLQGDLVRRYRSNAVEELNNNPYILTTFPGIGFQLADKVALHMGFARNSIKRKEAATLYIIQQTMQEGSVWISMSELVTKLKELIQVPDLPEGVYSLLAAGTLCQHQDHIALHSAANDESYIAEKLMAATFVDEHGDLLQGIGGELCQL